MVLKNTRTFECSSSFVLAQPNQTKSDYQVLKQRIDDAMETKFKRSSSLLEKKPANSVADFEVSANLTTKKSLKSKYKTTNGIVPSG